MELKPKPLTMQTAPMFREWAVRLSEFIKATSEARITRFVSELMQTDDAFAAAIADHLSGNGNASEVLAAWAQSNGPAAVRLHREMSMLPMTVAGITIGTECIRDTCDKIDSVDIASLEFADVRDYCAAIMDMATG